MVLEYFEEVMGELADDYGMNKSHICEYLSTLLTEFPIETEDVDLVSECLERVVSERSSIYKYNNPDRAVSLRETMEKAYEEVFGNHFYEGSDSLEATIREDRVLETLKIGKMRF